jgi:hypothetical protein
MDSITQKFYTLVVVAKDPLSESVKSQPPRNYIFASTMDGITLRSTHNAYEPPDHIKLVVELVRDLSNKYVPMPLLDEIEIDLLQSLKDFHHQARKRAAKVHLREKSSHIPPQNTSDISPPSSDTNADSWQEPDCKATEDNDHFRGFDTDLYDKISSNPEVASQHK